MLPKYLLAPLAALLLAAAPRFAQAQTTPTGGVGIGTTSPDASAVLDLTSTSKGLLPPRLSQAQRDAIGSPATGLTIYNTTTNKLNTWNGTSWEAGLSATEQPFAGGLAQTFTYTGAPQTYTVPAGVTRVVVEATGAEGGSRVGVPGGLGAQVRATLAVTPGQVLTVYVGGMGGVGNASPGPGGYNGGGAGSTFIYAGNTYAGGSGGGGASDVRSSASGTSYTDRLLVAAGGGGAGGITSGGAGGLPIGDTGGAASGITPGTGGTATAGGSGGGTTGQGGAGTGVNCGGGGGGYYGGGGSSYFGGGGGGSSWVGATGSGIAMTAGQRNGNGVVSIGPAPVYAAPALDGSNFVNLPVQPGDNLGNHTATTNLGLNDNWLSNAPGLANGLRVDNAGNVGIGVAPTATGVQVRTGEKSSVSGSAGVFLSGGAAGNPNIELRGTNGAAYLDFVNDLTTDYASRILSSGSGLGMHTGGSAGPRLLISPTGTVTMSSLAGTGTRMVVTDGSGNLSTQAVPSGGTGTADNLGNHTATTNIGLNGNWLSNAPGNANGLRVDNSGNVGLSSLVGSTTRMVTVAADGTLTSAAIPSGGTGGTGTADNLGNHTATQNLDLSSYKLVGNGGTTGLAIGSGGTVSLGSLAGSSTRMVTTAADGTLGSAALPTDAQTLSISGSTLSLSNGNSVTLPSTGGTGTADNLGNHTATTNIGLNGNWLSNAPGNANGLRVDGSGKVGVGTANPATALDVRTPDASAAVTVGQTDGTAGALYLGNSGHGLKRNYNAGANSVGLYTTAGTVYLSAAGTDNSNQFALLNGGNVGIGTATPTQRLEVAGQIYSSTGGFRFPDNTLQTTAGLTGGSAVLNQTTQQANANFNISGNGYVGGNVGIGTSSPAGQLANTAGNVLAADGNGISGQGLGWVNTSSVGYAGVFYNANNAANAPGLAVKVASPAAAALDVSQGTAAGTAGASLLRVQGGGNVGIGTASPGQKLEVAGQVFSSTGGFRFPDNTVQTTAAGSGNFIQNQTSADQTGGFRIGGTGYVGGRVGIGTTATPAEKLEIRDGNLQLTSSTGTAQPASVGISNNSGSLNLALAANSGEYSNLAQPGDAVLRSSGKQLVLAGRDGGSVLVSTGPSGGEAERLRVTTAGNVGIGTTSPSQKLDVSGNANVTGNSYVGGSVGIGTSAPTQALDVNGGILARSSSAISTQGAYLQWNRSGNQGETWMLNQPGSGSGGIRFGSATTANATTEWARFDGSGNLGIGTTAPGQKLEVAGGIKFTGTGNALTFPDGSTQTTAATAVNAVLNQTALQSGANFNIGGNGYVGGNVGIGTITPGQKLDVNGNTNVTGNSYVGGNVGIGTTATLPNKLAVVGGGTGAQPLLLLRNPSGGTGNGVALDLQTYDPGTNPSTARLQATDDGNASAHLSFLTKVPGAATNALTERLRIASNGNVGIGTAAPGQLLDVAGAAATTTTGTAGQLRLSRPGTSGSKWSNTADLALGSYAAGVNSLTRLDFNLGNGATGGTDMTALTLTGSGNVGMGTTTPAASAALEVASTTKGFLPPRLDQGQRDAIASPATGLVIYNTSTNKLNTWNGTSWTDALNAVDLAAPTTGTTFSFTGAVQSYTVPPGVTQLQVTAAGAQGGSDGGRGALVQTTLTVTPGEVLNLYVGGAGVMSNRDGVYVGGGWNGGGSSTLYGGGGGGATDIRRAGTDLANRVVVAAGGGGASGRYIGGAGGGPNGGDATANFDNYRQPTGSGATQSAPGYPNGSLGQGGNGEQSGGGGGGYFGGGSSGNTGYPSGGGGGSSWVEQASTSGTTYVAGSRSGAGFLNLTPAATPTATTAAVSGANVQTLQLTQAQRDALNNPSAGLLIYNLTTGRLNLFTGTGWVEFLSASTSPGQPGEARSFYSTGAVQTYTVPAGVTQVVINAQGAGGGRSNVNGGGTVAQWAGGAGAQVQAVLSVTPGQVLNLFVGGAGTPGRGVGSSGGGGFNGGGTGTGGGGLNGGGGGGATDVRVGGTTLAERVLVAAGGGGGGRGPYPRNYAQGGAGGQPTGQAGAPGDVGSNGGSGATQTTGAALGQGASAGANGGGGGGGGYYGGGSGSYYGGGGGGSSWAAASLSSVTYSDGPGGDGSITIAPVGTAAPALNGANITNVPGTWQVSGADVYRAGGNVGIGTSSPSQKLEVAGGIRLTGAGNALTFPDNSTLASGNLTGDITSTGAATTYYNVVPAAKGGAGTVNGLLKADGSGQVSAAVAGTDYLTPAAAGTGFIQNTTSLQAGSSFNISGSGTVGTALTAGSATVRGTATIGGNLGVGTTTPGHPLTVQADGSNRLLGFNDASGSDKYNFSRQAATGSGASAVPGGLNLSESNVAGGRLFVQDGGNVGLGTTNPQAGLHLDRPESGSSTALGVLIGGGTSGNPSIELRGSGKSPYLDFVENTGLDYSTRLISQAGTLNILWGNTGTKPTNIFNVDGGIRATAFNTASDARFKANVRPIGSALASVLALRGVRYDWNALGVRHGGTAGAPQVGMLAQEVEKIYPELVSTDKDGYKAVNYAQLTPVLIEALKEQQQQIEALKAANARAGAELQTVKAQATADKAQATAALETFEARLRRLEAATGGQAQR